MRRDQPKTPEPMKSTLPNTDQPRILHSEYHYKKSEKCNPIWTIPWPDDACCDMGECVCGGWTRFVHGRSRMTIDPRIPNVPGRSTLGFPQPGCCDMGGRGGRAFWAPKNICWVTTWLLSPTTRQNIMSLRACFGNIVCCCAYKSGHGGERPSVGWLQFHNFSGFASAPDSEGAAAAAVSGASDIWGAAQYLTRKHGSVWSTFAREKKTTNFSMRAIIYYHSPVQQTNKLEKHHLTASWPIAPHFWGSSTPGQKHFVPKVQMLWNCHR